MEHTHAELTSLFNTADAAAAAAARGGGKDGGKEGGGGKDMGGTGSACARRRFTPCSDGVKQLVSLAWEQRQFECCFGGEGDGERGGDEP